MESAMVMEAEKFIPTRQTLLTRLKNWDDHKSWQEFFETYWKLIYSSAIKAGLTESEAQDVVQETVISVARHMPGFEYDPKQGSFKSWLGRVIRWRIQDQLRRRLPPQVQRYRRPVNARTATVERVPDADDSDPARAWDEEWDKNIVDVAITRVKQQVDSRQFQLFDLNVLQGWPVKKIVALLGVSAGRVYIAKHRISALIQKEIRRLESKGPIGRQ